MYPILSTLMVLICQLCLSNQLIDKQLYDCKCSDSSADLHQSIERSGDYLRSRMSNHTIPGLGVGVSREGHTVWLDSFGWSDLENMVAVRNDSVWRMASISKAFTSALIGQLIDQKRIDLHQSIHQYLSEDVFPIKQWNGRNVSITLAQLMSHSAGIRVSSLDNDYKTIYEFKNVTDSLRQFKDEPLISQPGTQYNYSNFGYQVVGAVAEAVLKKSFDEAIDPLFKRMALRSTFCEKHQMIIKHKVHDYIRSDSPFLPEDISTRNGQPPHIMNAMLMDDLLPFEAQWPSGAIVSSTSDLLTFGNFMMTRYNSPDNATYDILSPSAVKKIWTPVIEKYHNEFGSNKNAHGWAVTELDRPIECLGHCQMPNKISKVIWKAGQLTGLNSIIMVVPQQRIVVTIVGNNSNMDDIFESALIVAKNFMF